MWTGVTGTSVTITLDYDFPFTPLTYPVEEWAAQASAGTLSETELRDKINRHSSDPTFAFYTIHLVVRPPAESAPKDITETLCASTVQDVPTVELQPIAVVTYSIKRGVNPQGGRLILTIESRVKTGSAACP